MGMEYTKGRKKPPRKTKPWRGSKRGQAWRAAQTSRRERDLITDRAPSAETIAAENLARIDKRRKPPPTTFIAKQRDTCNDCHRPIEPGERCHYRPDVGIVHHRHDRTEDFGEPCPECWMVGPCDCGASRDQGSRTVGPRSLSEPTSDGGTE